MAWRRSVTRTTHKPLEREKRSVPNCSGKQPQTARYTRVRSFVFRWRAPRNFSPLSRARDRDNSSLLYRNAYTCTCLYVHDVSGRRVAESARFYGKGWFCGYVRRGAASAAGLSFGFWYTWLEFSERVVGYSMSSRQRSFRKIWVRRQVWFDCLKTQVQHLLYYCNANCIRSEYWYCWKCYCLDICIYI